jgi:hypothetical protein
VGGAQSEKAGDAAESGSRGDLEPGTSVQPDELRRGKNIRFALSYRKRARPRATPSGSSIVQRPATSRTGGGHPATETGEARVTSIPSQPCRSKPACGLPASEPDGSGTDFPLRPRQMARRIGSVSTTRYRFREHGRIRRRWNRAVPNPDIASDRSGLYPWTGPTASPVATRQSQGCRARSHHLAGYPAEGRMAWGLLWHASQ